MSNDSGVVRRKRQVVKNTTKGQLENDDLKSKLKYIIDNDLDIITELKKLDIVDLPNRIPDSRSELKEFRSNSLPKSDKPQEKSFAVHDDNVTPLRSSNGVFTGKPNVKSLKADSIKISGCDAALVDYKITCTDYVAFPIEDMLTHLAFLGYKDTINKKTVLYNNTTIQYTSTKDTTEGLFPNDIVKVTCPTFDIGILCSEIYSNDMVLHKSTPLVLNDLTLGEDYRTTSTGVPEATAVDINMSTARDISGNVYALNKGVTFSMLEDYLEKTDDVINKIEPSNVSEQPPVDQTTQHHLPTIPKGEKTTISISCYVKGFLIFSSKSPDATEGSTTDAKYRVTMLWLNQPTFIQYTKTGTEYTLKFDCFMDCTVGTTKSFQLKEAENYELPIKSDFYKTNFTGFAQLPPVTPESIDILSLTQ